MALTSSPEPSRLNRALRYIRPNSVGEMTLQLMDYGVALRVTGPINVDG